MTQKELLQEYSEIMRERRWMLSFRKAQREKGEIK